MKYSREELEDIETRLTLNKMWAIEEELDKIAERARDLGMEGTAMMAEKVADLAAYETERIAEEMGA